MNSENLDISLTPRTGPRYNLRLNRSSIEILALVFEFKVVGSWHITRFLIQKDRSRYIYTKLRRMWQAGYLESFKLFTGSMAGIPLYYTLSRAGLKVLAGENLYSPSQLSKVSFATKSCFPPACLNTKSRWWSLPVWKLKTRPRT